MKASRKKLPRVTCKKSICFPEGSAVYYWEVNIPCVGRNQARAIARVAKTPQPDLVVDMAMALRKEAAKYKQRGRIRNYIMEAYSILDALGLWRGRE